MSDELKRNATDWATLIWQIVILAGSVTLVVLFARSFPYPSPTIQPLLDPQKRWPVEKIKRDWEEGNVPAGFLDYFLRDPERTVPAGNNIVAPADGIVRAISSDADWTYLDIALTLWDVHVQRSPLAGRVLSVETKGDTFMNGEFKNMVYLRDKMAPVQKVLTMETEFGVIKTRLITSIMAQRIRLWVQEGDELKKGQRIGQILLGSTVILQLPRDLPVAVKVGQRVAAGESLIMEANE
ncbi:phosphatidylserine decarboxylase [Salinisphaera dokdonensis CL-ES53]|uniref:Phosphatidylserine decarboxylase n=1 Tax=Salinisphaera dokdonensis CL-ES53 TaxID=1304272 RepID=A0ABV2B5I7_9GAMM